MKGPVLSRAPICGCGGRRRVWAGGWGGHRRRVPLQTPAVREAPGADHPHSSVAALRLLGTQRFHFLHEEALWWASIPTLVDRKSLKPPRTRCRRHRQTVIPMFHLKHWFVLSRRLGRFRKPPGEAIRHTDTPLHSLGHRALGTTAAAAQSAWRGPAAKGSPRTRFCSQGGSAGSQTRMSCLQR